MTTTPRDAIGLSERLREEADRLSCRSLNNGCATCGVATNLADEAATQLDALSARVKELEEHNRRIGQGGAERFWENRYRDEAAERTALSLDLEKVQTELDQEYARATRAEQERDAAKCDAERYRFLRGRDLDTIHKGGVFAGMTPQNIILNEDDLDREVDAAIRQLKIASGPDKEKRE